MKRLRQIKLYGNTYVITLSKIDLQDMKLKEGDSVDISLLKLQEDINQNDKT